MLARSDVSETKQAQTNASPFFEANHPDLLGVVAPNSPDFKLSQPELLLHELQLKNQLSQCIHQARRSDFALMLAMLSDDVREQSQFYLPSKEEQADKNYNDAVLRAEFELPKPQSLALKTLSDLPTFNQASLVKDNQLDTLRLINVITAKPIAFRDNKKFIGEYVLSNTTLVCQKKYQRYLENVKDVESVECIENNEKQATMPVLNQEKLIDAVNWFKAIQQVG